MPKQTNSKETISGLLKGIIACTSVTLGLVLVVIILVFGLQAAIIINPETPPLWFIYAVESLSIIELINDIALIVLTIISIVLVEKIKQINTNNFRLTFGLLIGFFVLFMILSNFYNVFAFFQLIVVVLLLVFAIVYKNKLRQ